MVTLSKKPEVLPSVEDIEMEFYEKFFFSKDFEPYPVQEEAFEHIYAGHNVMIMVPTGTGKTMMAKAGIYKALRLGQKAVYTTPLRALTEEKFREFCEDFGEENVGFATGDYKVNPSAPIQVVVAEILWNKIYSARQVQPADIVIMDEGHYFNDSQRGYVWEQSILGLHPATQLVVLSATVGNPQEFCQWAYVVRRVPMKLVQSHERRIPLEHHYEEKYLVEVIKELFNQGDYPAIVFGFNRRQCFERAKLIKSLRRFTTEEERKEIEEIIDGRISPEGIGPTIHSYLMHGIGIHHAGILPVYKQVVEELTLRRLVKFVVSTETIAAGINLPAKRVIFPSLVKGGRKNRRLLEPAEYHQMAGRAGRPQFDTEGIAITLAPEHVVQDFRKEIAKADTRSKYYENEETIKKRAYSRARSAAQQKGDLIWDAESHRTLIEGKSANLASHTRITAEQALAIGFPNLSKGRLPGFSILDEDLKREQERKKKKEKAKKREEKAQSSFGSNLQFGGLLAQLKAKEEAKEEAAEETTEEVAEDEDKGVEVNFLDAPELSEDERNLPVYLRLNVQSVVDNLMLQERDKRSTHKSLAKIARNLRALEILDERGKQLRGFFLRNVRGMDGLFLFHCLMKHDMDYLQHRQLLEFMVDHNIIQRILNRKNDEKKRDWIRTRLRERRQENPQIGWEEVEAEYYEKFPRELSFIEETHQTFLSRLPHPDLHEGKEFKEVWAMLEDSDMRFMDFVEEYNLQEEEGSLFSYLTRLINTARMIYETTGLPDFLQMEIKIRSKLAVLDRRLIDDKLWGEDMSRYFRTYRPPKQRRQMRSIHHTRPDGRQEIITGDRARHESV